MENDLTTSAAAVSYFSMLVLFPTLLLLLTVGSNIFGPQAIERHVLSEVRVFFPAAQSFIHKNLDSIADRSAEVIISCAIVMLWAASWLFMVLEKALCRVWRTHPRSFLHGRAVNLVVMSIVFALLGASVLFTTLVTALRSAASRLPLKLADWFLQLSGVAWQIVFFAASLTVTIALFTLIYKGLPNVKVPWNEALTGAILSGLLWEGAKFGFAYLLPYFHYDLLYGSIGAGVALLTWVYLSSVILLFGAQFAALMHRVHLFDGSGAHSTEHKSHKRKAAPEPSAQK